MWWTHYRLEANCHPIHKCFYKTSISWPHIFNVLGSDQRWQGKDFSRVFKQDGYPGIPRTSRHHQIWVHHRRFSSSGWKRSCTSQSICPGLVDKLQHLSDGMSAVQPQPQVIWEFIGQNWEYRVITASEMGQVARSYSEKLGWNKYIWKPGSLWIHAPRIKQMHKEQIINHEILNCHSLSCYLYI